MEKSQNISSIRNFADPYIQISGSTTILKIAEGWNNSIYQIGDEYLVKTPLNHKGEDQMILEIRVSRFLQGKISAPIPSFLHYGKMDDGNFAALYRKIDGVNITNKEYGRQEDRIKPDCLEKDEKLKFFRSISEISIEIMSISNEGMPEVAIRDGKTIIKHYMDMLRLARENIFNLIDRNSESRIEEYFGNTLKPEVFNFNPCFIHGDLGGWNILYDRQAMKISGLLDWGNASLSDFALDYSELVYDYGDEFSAVFMDYMKQKGIKHDPGFLKRSAFYVNIAGIIDALYGIETGNNAYIKQGLEEIEMIF